MPPKTSSAIKMALEQTLEGIQIINRDWIYVYINTAAANHGRTSKENLEGRTMMECYPGIETTDLFKDLEYVMKERQLRRVENQFVYEDGSKCWFELYIEPYTDGILIRSIDIDDKKQLESQLYQSQKMEAIGRLAGGVAHDFNNKLAIMLVYCELLKSKLNERNDDLEKHVDKMIDAVLFSSNLTRQLLAFSRKQVLDPKVVDINELIVKTKDSLKAAIEEHIKISFELSPDLKKVKVDPTQLEQVILNLCINARDSMPDGGRLIIETANAELDEAYAKNRMDVTPGDYVMICFTDTGTGMSPETVEKIFEPFFTTKDFHKGTGLGLSTVHGIVKQSRGHIWVYSELGIGSVFKIYFPVAEEKSSSTSKTKAIERPKPEEGSVRILIVEDDTPLREAYELALKSDGYNVTTACNAKEAKEQFEAADKFPDLLVTDLVLPGKSGKELAEDLLKIHPDMKVIYMSGYTENTIVHHGVLDTESVLLQKPFSMRTLLDTIAKVLDGEMTKGLV